MLRGSAVAIIVAVIAVIGSFGTNALIGQFSRKSARKDVPVQIVASATPISATSRDSLVNSTAPVVQQGDVAPVGSTPAAAPAATAMAPLIPIIAQGQSMLRDSVAAMRIDSVVTLSFDSPMLRTRMPVKFEFFLRSTLRQIYGQAIDSTLASIPEGAFAAQGDLLAELPTSGIHIPVADGWRLDVYPETRPGREGPLVIRYRASVVRP